MDIDDLRKYCLSKSGVTESLPFDNETLVFKVGSKIFCLVGLNPPFSRNRKSEPEKAVELREEYEEIKPGYHMNKKHWNTVSLEGRLENSLIKEMIDESYFLVYKNLPKREKEVINFDN